MNSSINRQIFSSESNVGKKKVCVLQKECALINNDINITTYDEYIDKYYSLEFLSSCDLIIDAVENSSTKLILK